MLQVKTRRLGDTYTRADQTRVIGVKLLKSSVGGKDVFVTRKLRNIKINLSDEDAFLIGEAWGALTDTAPEDIIVYDQFSIYSED